MQGTPSSPPLRVPLRLALILGFAGLVLIAVAGVLYLGYAAARKNTIELLHKQAETLIGSMIGVLERELDPIVAQAKWIADEAAAGRLVPSAEPTFDAFMQGTLAATASEWGAAVVFADGTARVHLRRDPGVAVEDWSRSVEVSAFLKRARGARRAEWGRPYWIAEERQAIVNLRTPLFRGERFLGFLWQAVSIARLSRSLIQGASDDRLVPFVLYDRHWVLAHPLLSELQPNSAADIPLPELAGFADGTLAAIWKPPARRGPLGGSSSDVSAKRVAVGAQEYDFVYRTIERYSDKPLTVGAYVKSGALYREQLVRLQKTAIYGAGILVLAMIAALAVGRAIGRPIVALAAAARRIGAGEFDAVPSLSRQPIREIDDASVAFNKMVEGLRERRLIRDLLGTYVPESVARQLIKGQGALEPMAAEATVLFVDLAGFTAMVEQMPAPAVVALLNDYFSVVTEILERHRGVITQFQGDAVLAVFNVPVADAEHARHAVQAAIAIRGAVEARTFSGRTLRVRIGIATGEVVAGSVGASGRLTFTVHGDAVNLAARLEQMNKEFGTSLLIAETTAARLAEQPLERLATCEVRGKAKPVTVYTVKS